MQTYARPELVFTHGEGARLYDAHGKEYLDFAAGIAVNALGQLPLSSACWCMSFLRCSSPFMRCAEDWRFYCVLCCL